ncbi:MAG: adenylate/guanylate cyclase domain-containing protein [Salaquimonas sp.]|nr:adenylate/guanylate cyclase domain-containing protein [Salaquimonas sp.]
MRHLMGRLRTALGFSLARVLGLCLLAIIIALRIYDPVFISTIRNQSFDLYQRINTRAYAPAPVVIVDIDEKSLAKYGQWPWPRTRIAELIDKLSAAGVLDIGFDIVFAEPDRLSPARIAADNPDLPEAARMELLRLPDNEAALAHAIAASRVVVGETAARLPAADQFDQKVDEVPYAIRGEDPAPFLTSYSSLVQNMPAIRDAAAGRGVFTVVPDPDGIYRRVPLVMLVADRYRLALSTEVLRIATGGSAFFLTTDSAGIKSVTVGGVAIPTDRHGMVWPWFSRTDQRRYVSAADILSGEAPPDAVAGKMVLVGTSAVGLEDYRATPVEAAMPGVEIHAQIIENILTGQFLTRPYTAIGMELIFIAFAGVLIIWLVPLMGAVWAAIAAIACQAMFIGGSYWAFVQNHVLVDPSYPFAATTALFIMMATTNYMREEVQRRQIRSAFSQYLSPALVEQLSDDPSRLVLGGETRQLSVLFTDVRGFTSISESFKANPQGLTRLMNRFLTVMSNAILETEGTIDKYMGDAIMAFWNAPVDAPDHALRACRAALLMRQRVAELNATARTEINRTGGSYHEINIGIGINTGDCVVGNMGSEMRFDYTALGDAVNLASRLEGQSKPFGVPIILGETTALAAEAEFAMIEIDQVRVKGKAEPERLHTLLGDKETAASEVFGAVKAGNAEMLAAYRTQKWAAAEKAIAALEKLSVTMDIPLDDYLDVYRRRIAQYRANPPGKDWDAVYDATEK